MSVDFNKDLHAKIRASLIFLMQSCLEMKNYDAPYFNAMRDEVLQNVLNITEMKDFTVLREKVIHALRKLYTAKVYFNLAEEWSGYNTVYRQSAAHDVQPPTAEIVFRQHMKNLAEMNEQKKVDINELCEWMCLIPLRLTTAKYHDYIADAAEAVPLPVNLKYAEDFKRLFNPQYHLGDEDWLAEIKKELDDIWENETITEVAADKLDEINNRLIQLTAYASALFDAVDASLIVRQGLALGLDLLAIPGYEDLYERFKANDKKDELLNLSLDNAADEAMNAVKYDDRTPIETDGFDAETEALYKKWLPVNEYYYETAFDFFTYLSSFNDEGQERDVSAFADALHEYMDSSTANLSSKRKRFLRQQFLKYLPYPYELEDYHKYFTDTYESLDDVNRRLLSFIVLTENEINNGL
jgi:hypothetical protein